MSALNKKGVAPVSHKVVSFEGNTQDVKAAEQQLYEALVMTMWGKDSFYESNDDRLARLKTVLADIVKRNNFSFIGNAIIYARTVMNIRSMPVIIAVEFARELRDQKKQYLQLRNVITDVIQRADQITDLYAYALAVFGDKSKVPMAIRRGVADAFNKFNEYQFGKYNRDGVVKLKDVLRIVHPTGKTPTQGELFAKIMKDELATPNTWETKMSANGQKSEEDKKTKAEIWTDLVKSGDVGYMALLRNLRNIIDAGVDNATIKDYVAKTLADPVQVKKSKQLPFSFLTAYEAIGDRPNVLIRDAIEEAVDHSLANLPNLGKNVWIIIDCSLSMRSGAISGTPIKTAALFAAALYKAQKDAENVTVTMFSDAASHVHQYISRKSSVLFNTNALMQKTTGGGTNLWAALEKKEGLGFEPDTVVLFSDMQVTRLSESNRKVIAFTPDTLKVAVNLEAYESTPVIQGNGWYQLGGFSERMFDFIPAMKAKHSVTKVLSQPYFGITGAKNLFSK